MIPGESSYEILFAYDLPFDRKLDWQLPLDLPTDVAVLFVEGDTVNLSSETLAPGGIETLDQGVFQVMVADTLAAGDTIDLQIEHTAAGRRGYLHKTTGCRSCWAWSASGWLVLVPGASLHPLLRWDRPLMNTIRLTCFSIRSWPWMRRLKPVSWNRMNTSSAVKS